MKIVVLNDEVAIFLVKIPSNLVIAIWAIKPPTICFAMTIGITFQKLNKPEKPSVSSLVSSKNSFGYLIRLTK